MKLLIFDLDGVLADTCNIHYQALNDALGKYAITPEDHATTFNGLNTVAKLNILVNERGLPKDRVDGIFLRKQELTAEALKSIPENPELQSMLETLSADYMIYCATNCIWETARAALDGLGIYKYFDCLMTNQDVVHPKPDPEIYLKCMEHAGVSPRETIIFEDSYTGLQAARKSKAHVQPVTAPLTIGFVRSAIGYYSHNKTFIPRNRLFHPLTVVIPMAGNGSRFAKAGYPDPKPFIPVFGAPMISYVVRNLGVDAKFVFIVRREFLTDYNADGYLRSLVPNCTVIPVDSTTEGAACTVLLAEKSINNNRPILIANSDQWIEFDVEEFVFDFLYNPSKPDGKISTFDGKRDPKWSYAAVGADGFVTEVKEKDPFSDHATTGVYMWQHGCDFVKYAKQMISKNIRVNNEFYTVPVYNEAIQDGKKITVENCKQMWGLGVPEDLEYFLANYK